MSASHPIPIKSWTTVSRHATTPPHISREAIRNSCEGKKAICSPQFGNDKNEGVDNADADHLLEEVEII